MPDSPIGKLMQQLQHSAASHNNRKPREILIDSHDWLRLQALAELFDTDPQRLAGELLAAALDEAEARMPYVPGKRVIRVEEGDPVYEDIGLTPRYLEILRRLEAGETQ